MSQFEKGMMVYVLRSGSFSDCTLGGPTSKANEVLLVGPGVPELHSASENCPVLLLKSKTLNGSEYLYAVPYPEPKGMVCSGGNFIYDWDSRFPHKYPISVHDRVEPSGYPFKMPPAENVRQHVIDDGYGNQHVVEVSRRGPTLFIKDVTSGAEIAFDLFYYTDEAAECERERHAMAIIYDHQYNTDALAYVRWLKGKVVIETEYGLQGVTYQKTLSEHILTFPVEDYEPDAVAD